MDKNNISPEDLQPLIKFFELLAEWDRAAKMKENCEGAE